MGFLPVVVVVLKLINKLIEKVIKGRVKERKGKEGRSRIGKSLLILIFFKFTSQKTQMWASYGQHCLWSRKNSWSRYKERHISLTLISLSLLDHNLSKLFMFILIFFFFLMTANLFLQAEIENHNLNYAGFEEHLSEATQCYLLAIDVGLAV